MANVRWFERRDGDRLLRFEAGQIERKNRLDEAIAAVYSDRQPLSTGLQSMKGIHVGEGKAGGGTGCEGMHIRVIAGYTCFDQSFGGDGRFVDFAGERKREEPDLREWKRGCRRGDRTERHTIAASLEVGRY